MKTTNTAVLTFFSILIISLIRPVFAANPSVEVERQRERKYSPLTCPSIPAQYETLLNKLITLKSSIKSQANCQPILDQVSRYGSEQARERDRFVQILETSKNQNVQSRDIEWAREYSHNATEYAFTLVDLMTRNQHCFDEDRKEDGLSMASTLVYEVSSFAAGVAGPYGAPIAIAGGILGGFFKSLDNMNKNKVGYKFDRPASLRQYASNLCSYFNMQSELETLLYPRSRTDDLRKMAVAVKDHLEEVVETCTNCGDLYRALKDESLTIAYNGDTTQDILKDIQNLELNINNDNNNQIGSYIIETYNSQQWLEDQLNEVTRESQDLSVNLGQDLLMDEKLSVEGFLIDRETPRFLDYQIGKSMKGYHKMTQYYRRNIAPMLNNIEALRQGSTSKRRPVNQSFYSQQQMEEGLISLERALEDEELNLDYKTVAKTIYNRFINLYDSSLISLGVFNNYCDFFREANLYSFSVMEACTHKKVEVLTQNLSRLSPATSPFSPNINRNKNAATKYRTWSEAVDDIIAEL